MISIDEGCRSDLRFWSLLLNDWNGISFFYNDEIETSVSLAFFTDAAPSCGFGGVFNRDWFAEKWPAEMISLPEDVKSTALFEMYPIAVACILWGKSWNRKRITVFCDNEAAVNIINKGRSSVSAINRIMRRITWTCVMNNFILRAAFVPGLDNKMADALSRFKFQEFHVLCPEAMPSGLKCPTFSQTVLD